MITLHAFGAAFGLPDPSPFVTKADVLMKMSGLPYRTERGNIRRAPKGKLPYIDDDGTLIPDSTFIRMHLEARHGIDFDPGLSAAERGIAWAFEKLCEEQIYWAVVHSRWLDDANFDQGPRRFFRPVPALMRPLVISMVRRGVRRTLHGQGLGRHTAAERLALVSRSLEGLSAFLADKPYLMGSAPCGADAAVFAAMANLLTDFFDTPLRQAAARHANLVAYRDRLMKRYYPDFKPG